MGINEKIKAVLTKLSLFHLEKKHIKTNTFIHTELKNGLFIRYHYNQQIFLAV